MTYYSGPEELAANPPETWRVEKRGERSWSLCIAPDDNGLCGTFTTQRAALAERDDPQSYTRRAVEQERLWYAGVTPGGWKTYAERLEDRRRNEAYQAKRRAAREAATA